MVQENIPFLHNIPSITLPSTDHSLENKSPKSLKQSKFSRQNAVSNCSTPEGNYLSVFDACSSDEDFHGKKKHRNKIETSDDSLTDLAFPAQSKNKKKHTAHEKKSNENFSFVKIENFNSILNRLKVTVQTSLDENYKKKKYLKVRRTHSHCHYDLKNDNLPRNNSTNTNDSVDSHIVNSGSDSIKNSRKNLDKFRANSVNMNNSLDYG